MEAEHLQKTKQTAVPVRRLLQDLVDADPEGLVLVALLDEVLVNPELGRCDRLSLRNTGEVETKFPPVLLVEKILTRVNYRGGGGRQKP